MNFYISSRLQKFALCATLTAGLSGASTAGAAAYVHPEVRAASGKVRVIVTLKDQAPLRANARLNYRDAVRALHRNATLSQRQLVSMLRSERSLSGSSWRYKQFWIVNAMAVELPASQVGKLENHPSVKAIYPNSEMRIIPGVRSRYIMERRSDAYTYGLEKIRLPALREVAPSIDGRGVTVGILDTGLDPNHPDVRGKMIGFKDFVNNRTAAYDDHGHGTHVAGTIAGSAASGTAIGVAPAAKLLIGKVFSARGSGSTDQILAAMQWMADPDSDPTTPDHPALVSNSWGGGAPSASQSATSHFYCQAVGSWVKLGIFPVFAAGNSGSRPGTVGIPGACPEAFAVGATDKNDAVASFSSRGPTQWKEGVLVKPDISAPGVDILSALPNGKYEAWSGTSMATPHVAGLLALLYQINPKASVSDLSRIVMATSKDLGNKGRDPNFGEGRIDAYSAVRASTEIRRRSR